jgi:hypothetical protein
LAMLREITAKLLEVCGLQALYRDASGRSPQGELCGPKKTPTYRSRGETALRKPLTKLMHITPCGRALQRPSLDQGPARGALEAYVPRLILSPSS